MLDRAMQKYLSRYAEQEVRQLAEFPVDQQFEHCLVIPAYRESADFFTRLQLGPLHSQRALCIVVINQPKDDPDTEPNRRLMHHIESASECVWHNSNLKLFRYPGSSNQCLVVDCFSRSDRFDRRLPRRQGVGLARKIGCDLAAALIGRSQITAPWIHSTDADVFLPHDYFALPEPGSYSVALYSFTHQNTDSPVGQATALYEQALMYYVQGLAWAGSPYAFHTVGSTIAINALSYCHVRGFPRRSGGEDFYLLNKLAKVGAIYHADTTLRIQARLSDRVPFGTGPTVAGILRQADPLRDYTCYNPHVFDDLREWLSHIPKVWDRMQAGEATLGGVSKPIREAVQAAGWSSVEGHLKRQARDAQDATRTLHHWFDAFQTLKFVHFLQAHYYSPMPLVKCLDQAPFSLTAAQMPNNRGD